MAGTYNPDETVAEVKIENQEDGTPGRHAAAKAAPSAVDACRYFAGLLLGALGGRSKEEILSAFFCPGQERDYWQRHALSPEIAEIANGSFKQKEPAEIIGSGFVVRSLEAALWAFHRSDSFREGALRAVNLGDDADTTGAIYGQLAGAYYVNITLEGNVYIWKFLC
jgi:ADP-ribosylglycohydrolase